MNARLEANIYQEPNGTFRVFRRGPDPRTGLSKKTARRFPPGTPLEKLRAYRDARKPRQPPRAFRFRLRYGVHGGHIRCRLFERRPPGETWAKNGDLVFTGESWPVFRELLQIAGVDALPE